MSATEQPSWAEKVLQGRSKVLERLATGGTLDEILHLLVESIEAVQSELLCSILLYDQESGCLRNGIAPSLPEFYNRAVDRIQIGPKVGSCGAAAYTKKRIIAEDILTHPNWAPFRGLACSAGIRSCWSQPIISSSGAVLGTFAMYYRVARHPCERELELITTAAHLAEIAIERKRAEAELIQHREQLEGLVQKRTAELEKSQQQLRSTERLASLGTLAAGIAHELNNPLGLIRLSLDAARAGANDATVLDRALTCIDKQINRCTKIIRGVKRFARRETSEKELLDINEVLIRAKELTEPFTGKQKIDVELIMQESLPLILASPIDSEQVFVNLITNAANASSSGSRIVIRSERTDKSIRITVQDFGIGMTQSQLQHAFDPFFTTLIHQGGTGLGLSICHGIVSEHGASIDIQSTPQNGTEVIVDYPLHRTEIIMGEKIAVNLS